MGRVGYLPCVSFLLGLWGSVSKVSLRLCFFSSEDLSELLGLFLDGTSMSISFGMFEQVDARPRSSEVGSPMAVSKMGTGNC